MRSSSAFFKTWSPSILSLFLGAVPLSAQAAPGCSSIQPYSYDSGATSSPVRTVVSHRGAPWIQLDLSGTELAPGAELVLVAGGASETLGAAGLDRHTNGYSAMFAGDSVSVELLPAASPSRVAVSAVHVGLCDGAGERSLREDDEGLGDRSLQGYPDDFGVCGDVDNRRRSSDPRVGRLVPVDAGSHCTAFLISEDVFVTAGHCGVDDRTTRLHFGPLSSGGLADPENQYAIRRYTYDYDDGSEQSGKDWGAGLLLPNAVTGLRAGITQGWFNIGNPPSSGSKLRVTGYSVPFPYLTTATGDLDLINPKNGLSITHKVDAAPGSSGGPILYRERNVIAVMTGGSCGNPEAPLDRQIQYGTLLTAGDLEDHIDLLLDMSPPTMVPTTERGQRGTPIAPPTMFPTAFPTISPTANPTFIPTAEPVVKCEDDNSWVYVTPSGKNARCGWVSRVPATRCKRRGNRGNDKRVASEACPLACGICCIRGLVPC